MEDATFNKGVEGRDLRWAPNSPACTSESLGERRKAVRGGATRAEGPRRARQKGRAPAVANAPAPTAHLAVLAALRAVRLEQVAHVKGGRGRRLQQPHCSSGGSWGHAGRGAGRVRPGPRPTGTRAAVSKLPRISLGKDLGARQTRAMPMQVCDGCGASGSLTSRVHQRGGVGHGRCGHLCLCLRGVAWGVVEQGLHVSSC